MGESPGVGAVVVEVGQVLVEVLLEGGDLGRQRSRERRSPALLEDRQLEALDAAVGVGAAGADAALARAPAAWTAWANWRERNSEPLSVVTSWRKASAGELDGLDPFEIPKGSVYYIAGRERKRRQAAANAQQASTLHGKLRLQAERAAPLLESDLDRIERDSERTGKCDQTALGKVCRNIATLSRADLREKPPAPNGTAQNDKPSSDFLARLRERAVETPGGDASGV